MAKAFFLILGETIIFKLTYKVSSVEIVPGPKLPNPTPSSSVPSVTSTSIRRSLSHFANLKSTYLAILPVVAQTAYHNGAAATLETDDASTTLSAGLPP